ncbi:hypothetical protein BWI96_07670 [Siphonobacter sp. SORGH_AS_0500]|uniref:hypothetical protein n=1 Tax=Siphonobacter sp. SORGH_AS_0500 TaxID=1864824 RepID=UPI000CAC8006|nr:hypothetical protein [Siphonobacter sp. SORGH_AS_0500]PKK37216.1 hypothetical protein BWI96_07670 [Siphonobacter sp. SORGH_AS_0500]
MNPKISIDKSITYSLIDEYYEILDNCIDKSLVIDIELPVRFESRSLGIEAIIYQLVITWSRAFREGNIIINLDIKKNPDVTNLYENEILFTIITYSWNRHKILDNKHEIIPRESLKSINADINLKMLKAEILKGNKLLLTSFDHLPKNRGVLPCFEPNGVYIDNEFQLAENLQNSLMKIVNFSNTTKSIYRKLGMNVINIIYELMKNTNEWAKTDENSVPLDPNVRGLYMQFFKKTRKK